MTNLLLHAARLMTLRHDGDDLPADQGHALWLTVGAMLLSSLMDASQGVTNMDFVLFIVIVTYRTLLFVCGNFKMLTYSALISIAANVVRLAWLLGGAKYSQFGWVSAVESFAWVRAALTIGLF